MKKKTSSYCYTLVMTILLTSTFCIMNAQTENNGFSPKNKSLSAINQPKTLWTSIMETNNCDLMRITPDGGVVVLGALGGGDSYSIFKYDMNGVQKWNTLLGPKTNNEENTPVYVNSILASKDEGVSVSGYAGATPIRGGSVIVGYSCILGDNGEVKSIRVRAKDAKDAFFEGYNVPYIKTNTGNYAVLRGQSFTVGTTNNIQVYLRLINNEGIVYSEKIIDTLKDAETMAVPSLQETSDGGFLGYFYPAKNNNPKEWHIVKFDKNGIVRWSQVWTENAYGFKSGCAAIELIDGSVVAVNNTLGTPIAYAHIRQFSPTGELMMHTKISTKVKQSFMHLLKQKTIKFLLPEQH